MAIRDLKNQNADLIAEKIHIHGNVSQNEEYKEIKQKIPFRKFKEGRCENCQTPIHKEKIRHCEACLRKMFKFQEELLEYLGLTSEEIIFFRSFKKKQNFIFSFEDGKLVK